VSGNVQKISVLGGSSLSNDSFCDDGRSLGGSLAQSGRQVIIPGQADGVKGDVALGALYQQGSVVNVYPDPGAAPNEPHQKSLNDDLINNVIVDGRKGVKKSLDNRADVAVLMAGGLEELDQATHLMRRGTPMIIVNDSNFYDGLVEQIEAIKQSSLTHQFSGDNLAHIHVVSDIDEVMPIIELYKAVGTPEYDYAEKWSEAKAEDRAVRPVRDDKTPGFTNRGGRNMLSNDAGIVALDRATTALMEQRGVPLLVDNSEDFYDGLLAQFDTYIDEGAERESVFKNVSIKVGASSIPTLYIDSGDELDFPQHAL